MAQGAIPISEQKVEGNNTKLAISSTTGVVIKSSGGRLDTFVITNASTTTSYYASFYDASSTASTAASNLVGSWTGASSTASSTVVSADFPFLTGLVGIVSNVSLSVSVSFN